MTFGQNSMVPEIGRRKSTVRKALYDIDDSNDTEKIQSDISGDGRVDLDSHQR